MYFQNNFSYEGLPAYRTIPTCYVLPPMVSQYPFTYSPYRASIWTGLARLSTLLNKALRTKSFWLAEKFLPLIEKTVAKISSEAAGKAAREFVLKNAAAIAAKLNELTALETIAEKEIYTALYALFLGLKLPADAANKLAEAFITIIWAMALVM